MTQIPGASWCPTAARVSPESAPAPVHPATAAQGGRSEAIVTPEARQVAVDLGEAKRLSFAALVVRHARVLSALRVVWASRRRQQQLAADLLAEMSRAWDREERDDSTRALVEAVDNVKRLGGAIEIRGVRIEPCDLKGETATTRNVAAFGAQLEAMESELVAASARLAVADADKLTLDRVADELGCTRAQLDLWFARHVAGERDRARDDLKNARARIAELEAAFGRLQALTYASDDGSEYEHDHGIGDGHDECPACWAQDIRDAITQKARK